MPRKAASSKAASTAKPKPNPSPAVKAEAASAISSTRSSRTSNAKVVTTTSSSGPKRVPNLMADPEPAVTKPAASKNAGTKRKVSDAEELEERPNSKKSKTGKAAPAKKAAGVKLAAAKSVGRKRKAPHVEEQEEEPIAKKSKAEKSVIKPASNKNTTETGRKIAPVKQTSAAKEAYNSKTPATKKAPAASAQPKQKALPQINTRPTQKLDVFVFGEGTAGELGLGGFKYNGNKLPIDVARPRLNHRLSAHEVGVVQLAVGGMHCAALTHDNKIFTWGVNDTGALGRRTGAAKTKEIGKEDSDDDDDQDDDEEYLNPSEAEPRQVSPHYFPEGTEFAFLAASDSATFAVTTDGSVYGWGTIRGNEGSLGFRPTKVHSSLEDEEYEGETNDERKKRLVDLADCQLSPMLIPELKKIVAISCGTNHVLALNDKGKVFVWGAGEQNQLGRRVVSRTAKGALIPREFGLQRKKIIKIGSGDYHSFAVDKDGKVYAWGLNTFGQTGIPTTENQDDTILSPTVVKSLDGYNIKEIDGGAHHTIACTESGQVLVWGRIDNHQGGMAVDKFSEDVVYTDEKGARRYLTKPVVLPDLNGVTVSAYPDGNLVVTKEGKAYSWGFSGNYQTGVGSLEDVEEATWIDNTAVRDKKLVFCGAGGQFGVLAAPHTEDK